MPEEVRLWRIGESDALHEVGRASLDLEERIEKWIEQDISVLSHDLLVIGRQIPTDFGGFIDLLCIDGRGDLVVVELKRDKTPREVVAQALDYASWVKDLSSEGVIDLAAAYFGGRESLDQAFQRRFGQPLPETINGTHRMLVVGSKIDDSSERIIRYLADTYGVGINAATFQYFKTEDGSELLTRLFVMSEAEVESSPPRGKRLPNRSLSDLESIAGANGVGDLFRQFVDGLRYPKHMTRSSVAFTGDFQGSRRTILGILPLESDPERGLRYQIYSNRVASLLGIAPEDLRAILPPSFEDWVYYPSGGPEYQGYTGFFRSSEEIGRLVERLNRGVGGGELQ